MAEPRHGFRPDIQALRAVAVTAVVTYHLWPHALRGGFVGVDVFYVISGFLITGQLTREWSKTGRISALGFWARRIRRLLPAACAVLAASVVGMLTLLPKVTWAENTLEIKAAAVYVENWVLARHAVDYLAAGHSASLVQHYWSLSVEEQFYLCWPLLLLGALWLPFGSARSRAAAALSLVLLVSLAYSVLDTAADPKTAFFATTTRAWEFAVGGLVAIVIGEVDRRVAERSRAAKRIRLAVAACGAAAIGLSLALISGQHGFPGAVAMLPVFGAALVLGADAEGVKRWTRVSPVQWVGDNSYSIYLWHWPLIVAAPWVLHGSVTTPARLVIVAATLLLADLTRRFVEDPIRYGRRWRTRRLPTYAAAVLAIAVLVGVTSLPSVQGAQNVAAAQAQAAAHARTFERPASGPATTTDPAQISSAPGSGSVTTGPSLPPVPVSCYGAGAMVFLAQCPHAFDRPPGLDATAAAADGRTYECLSPAGTTTAQLCDFGRLKGANRTIAVVGNSHARRLIPALDEYGRHHRWLIVDATEINCMGVVTTPVAESPTDWCLQWSRSVVHKLLALPHLDAVIFASFVGATHFLTGSGVSVSSANRPAAERAMVQTWSQFSRRGIRVIVPQDVPGIRPLSDPECVAQSDVDHDPCAIKASAVTRQNIESRTALAHPEVATYLAMDQYFCDRSRCHGLIGGLVVYFDSNHMTATFSRSLAPYLGPRIAALLPPHH